MKISILKSIHNSYLIWLLLIKMPRSQVIRGSQVIGLDNYQAVTYRRTV
jgi:hypothetical protein